MVVTDAMLRGVPCITSSAGALPEAGLGCCEVVPVEPLQVPRCELCGTPNWAARKYPAQDVGAWEKVVCERLLRPGAAEAHLRAADACRQAALRFVGLRDQELQSTLAWLHELL